MFKVRFLNLDILKDNLEGLGNHNILSAFLYNVYLHELDQFILDSLKSQCFQVIKKKYQNNFYLKDYTIKYVRYGNEFLIGLNRSLN
jgi:hypothetical protein